MARKQLYINGTGTGEFGIYISSDTYLNAPAIDYTAHQVPGRSGDLLQYNRRLNNIIRKFDCYIPRDVISNFEAFKRLLYSITGYMDITSDYDPDTFQRGYLAEELTVEPFNTGDNLTAGFTLYFNCQPQKYFKDNDPEEITATKFPDTFGVYTLGVLPRSSTRVKTMLELLPTEATPKDDAFLFVGISNTNAASFSMGGYSGFVALIYSAFSSGYFEDGATTGIRAYSNSGSLEAEEITSGQTMLVLPVTATGTAVLKIGSSTYRWAMSKQGEIVNPDALGVGNYSFTVSGEFGRDNNSGMTDDPNRCFYIRGTLNGVQTISATIQIDFKPFFPYITADNETYNVSVTIDSETLQTVGTFEGTAVNISEYVNILGDLNGRADTVEIYAYWSEYLGHGFVAFYPRTYEIDPSWWKV